MKSSIFIGLTACWLAATALAATELAIIPQPQNLERAEGAFKLTPDLVIATDKVSKDTGEFLAERLRPATVTRLKPPCAKGRTRPSAAAQGNLWTEFIPNQKIAEYMAFQWQFALAEVVWSPKESRDYEGFLRRLKINEQRLDQLGVNYRNSALGGGTDSQNQTK